MAVNFICISCFYFWLKWTSLLLFFLSPFLAIACPYFCPLQKVHALFAALNFALCIQTGMLFLHAANGHANAKSGEKKRRREVKFSHKGKNKYILNSLPFKVHKDTLNKR